MKKAQFVVFWIVCIVFYLVLDRKIMPEVGNWLCESIIKCTLKG